MYKNLGEFIQKLKDEGEIRVIDALVDPILEITEISDRLVKKDGPALLFTNVKGSKFPLAINLFATMRRMEIALGVANIEEVSERIRWMTDLKAPEGWVAKIKMLPKLKALAAMSPHKVSSAPCQEVVMHEPDLGILPAIQCWPMDAGRYITLPLVITKDPETGSRNVGTYRMQIYDANSTGMHWQMHKDGTAHLSKARAKGMRSIDVAVVIGADPATIFSSISPLPHGIDELLFAGFLRGKPVPVVKCKTVDLEVPAEADFVLEGTVDVDERKVEGPFGDHTGYYSMAKEFPVFRIKCITHRKNAIYPTTIVGKPPMEDGAMGKAIERIFLPLIRTQFPEIVDMNLPVQGAFHNCLLISIRKSYPHQARKVVHGIWGFGQLMFEKMVLVFDEDVNIHDPLEVSWRAGANVDPKRDIFFSEGPVDELDISSSYELFGSKVGVDCTRKMREEGMMRDWPPDIIMDKAVQDKVTQRWAEYGLDA